jgi:acyl-coenzyme A synthetase/AMP-(fatty) acid ligase
MALRYLGSDKELRDGRGFTDTGDLVEAREGRYYFMGRRTGIINVGGLKVHPEEVEAVINSHPAVQMSRIIAKASPITGAIVVAQILPRAGLDAVDHHAIEEEVAAMCRRDLPPHKVPVRFNFVTSLEVGASGKLVRNHA